MAILEEWAGPKGSPRRPWPLPTIGSLVWVLATQLRSVCAVSPAAHWPCTHFSVSVGDANGK